MKVTKFLNLVLIVSQKYRRMLVPFFLSYFILHQIWLNLTKHIHWLHHKIDKKRTMDVREGCDGLLSNPILELVLRTSVRRFPKLQPQKI